MASPVRILHAHSVFALGGKEARAVQLMNAFGDAAAHSVISAVPGQLSAREAIDKHIHVDFPSDTPSLGGPPGPRLWKLGRYMRRFDLVLTYNWGAFDAVMARRLLGGPPLIHHEDGFNQDEAQGLKPRRNFYRRVGLGAAHRLIVPSEQLERVARQAWRQPPGRIERIPNGIATDRFRTSPDPNSIPGLIRKPGEIVIGTVAGLRPVKNLPRLVRAVAGMRSRNVRLVVVGQGPESDRIVQEARQLGMADRLILPGFLPDPHRYIGLFDIFALSSNSEQFPISLVEAMAAGLPVVATAVGDIPSIVSTDNRPLIVAAEDEPAFSAALDSLAERPDLRRAIGEANRERAATEFGERRMIERYARLYGEAIGRPQAFMSPLT